MFGISVRAEILVFRMSHCALSGSKKYSLVLLFIDVCIQNVGQMKLCKFCDNKDREHGKCRERFEENTDAAFTAEDVVLAW